MKTFYINLEKRPERRRYIETQISKVQLDAQRIDAVAPSQIPEDLQERLSAIHEKKRLTISELACGLSHRKAWQALLDSGEDMALIIEDDVVFSNDFRLFLDELKDKPPVFDVIKLETGRKVRVSRNPAYRLKSTNIHRLLDYDYNAAAYIVTRRFAQTMLTSEINLNIPIDDDIFRVENFNRRGLRTLICSPSLAIQLRDADLTNDPKIAESDIGDQRDERQKLQDAAQPQRFIKKKLTRLDISLRKKISIIRRGDFLDLIFTRRIRPQFKS